MQLNTQPSSWAGLRRQTASIIATCRDAREPRALHATPPRSLHASCFYFCLFFKKSLQRTPRGILNVMEGIDVGEMANEAKARGNKHFALKTSDGYRAAISEYSEAIRLVG